MLIVRDRIAIGDHRLTENRAVPLIPRAADNFDQKCFAGGLSTVADYLI